MAQQAKCQKCGEDYLIITKEIEAYKEKNLPLPKNCPKCRLERRMGLRNKKELYGYNCDKCGKDIITAVEPVEGVEIYCKTCYEQYMQQNDCILGYSEGAKKEGGQTATPTPKPAPASNQLNETAVKDPVDW